MAIGRQKLYRSSNGVVAGVCSGLADCMSIDTAVLRFAVIALTLVTGGGFALVYAALWLILPPDYAAHSTVDVQPDAVTSDNYGAVNDARAKRKTARDAAAHTPPQPPASPDEEVIHRQSNTQAPATFGTVIGIALVVAGFSFLLPFFFPVFSPLQFWPLILIAFGILRMVLPGSEGYRMNAFVFGAIILFFGVAILLQTTGFVYISFRLWLAQGFPLLLISAGCMVLWKATDLNGFAIAGLAAIVAFIMVGMLFCSVAGPAQLLIDSAPFSKAVAFPNWR